MISLKTRQAEASANFKNDSAPRHTSIPLKQQTLPTALTKEIEPILET
jgi:hypothetical protein